MHSFLEEPSRPLSAELRSASPDAARRHPRRPAFEAPERVAVEARRAAADLDIDRLRDQAEIERHLWFG